MNLSTNESAPQMDLFSCVAEAYKQSPDRPLSNDRLYELVAQKAGISMSELNAREPVGTSGQMHSLKARELRWHQQTLKHMGVIERVPGQRGVWALTDKAKNDLHPPKPGVKLLGFSTELGCAVWGYSQDVLQNLDTPITLAITSTPYPLRKQRAYGNPTAADFVDFICEILEPVVDKLSDDGSLVLNLSNDCFEPGSPQRSTYLERVTIAMEDRLGLSLMERFVWSVKNKVPGPIQWASKKRTHVHTGWEPILWFAKDPHRVKSCNQRVLQPHTSQHLKLMAKGGESRQSAYGDGAYRLKPGSYGRITEGAIPRNVIELSHNCDVGRAHRKVVDRLGLPQHGAGFPLALPSFLVRFLTEPDDLVVDFCAGRSMTGLAAQLLGRRWLCVEAMLEYIRSGAELFRAFPDFWMNPEIDITSSRTQG